ncbi:MAG: D-alanyl-D-alanine carboxypeptidase/D-alanyl-D-alanine-endopeptidase [Chlamydiota bacterium]|jgi:D-alanyl-D-alanine carboxypeptidase/D-alanyl-D-alanine-endopeptidase (penicillin-binding protein 4)
MKAILVLICLSTRLIASPLDHAIISIYAVNTKTGQVIIDEKSELSLIPSSCIKVVTTAAALEILGENSTFHTDLVYEGSIENGTLAGNLVIRGGGDPSLASPRFSHSWQEQIDLWASAIEKAGIRTIEGAILADVSLWEKVTPTPSWEHEDLANAYGALPSPLAFYENSYHLTFDTHDLGSLSPVVSVDPPLNMKSFQSEVIVAKPGSGDQAFIFEEEGKRVIRGTLPQTESSSFTIRGSIPHPETLCIHLLKKELNKRGISVLEKKAEAAPSTVLHTAASPPLSELVTHANRNSINLYTEHFVYQLGAGSKKKGFEAINHFLKEKGVDLEGFQMADGSGLSRHNLVTTKQLVALLVSMKENRAFRDSLERKGPIYYKTGSMSLIRSRAGYINDIAFAIIINNCTNGAVAAQKIDEICGKLIVD